MKKSLIIFAMVLLGTTTIQAQEGHDRFEVQVDGLGCPFCAYGLEKKFKEFKGIKHVKIDIQTGNFTFAYPADKALSLNDVKKQVEKAGYTPIAGGVTRADGSVEAMHETAIATPSKNQGTISNIRVAGNCEMCQARIEKAALQHIGVFSASWDKDTKILQLGYDENTTSLEAVEKAIAKIGHDTQHHRAHEEAYKNLPGCCHYERIQPEKLK